MWREGILQDYHAGMRGVMIVRPVDYTNQTNRTFVRWE